MERAEAVGYNEVKLCFIPSVIYLAGYIDPHSKECFIKAFEQRKSNVTLAI